MFIVASFLNPTKVKKKVTHSKGRADNGNYALVEEMIVLTES